MSYQDPTLSRPYHRESKIITGEKEGILYEILEVQPGEVDVYVSKDMGRGEVLDLLYDELKGYHLRDLLHLSPTKQK